MTVIEFAGISDFIGCDQKYENSYSEVLRFIRERMTFRVYTSVRDKFYPCWFVCTKCLYTGSCSRY